ncbi:MAG: SDR family NAD(P)-dependent oxidoreductase [Proteobacteria bacterium]|jgi:3-oxoacyl-[acyl-carrier protein] reductase|nr:SDR family NAD(P)-dependent oxidoreductase [Pseudomonadota bacterium]
MDLGLKGKRAIILGGSRGIGWYTAELMRQEGASVAICARGQEGVDKAVGDLAGLGDGTVFGKAVDLAEGEQVKAFCREAIDALGGADILIHNASGFDMDGSEEGWKRSFDVDMMAGVIAVEAVLPSLEASDAAAITLIGSMASKFYFGRRSSYGPAKAAMRAYANELAQSLGRKQIRANAISPGAVWFPGGSWDKRKTEMPEFYESVEKSIPLGRLGTGEELARVIAFVSSPAGMWINSAHIVVDGGQVASVD